MRLSKLHSLSWTTLGLATLLLGNSACELPFFGGDDPVTASCSVSYPDNINVCFDFTTEDSEAATADCTSLSGTYSLSPCSVGTAGTCVGPNFTGDADIPASLKLPTQIQMGGSGLSVPLANEECVEASGGYQPPTNVSASSCLIPVEDGYSVCFDIVNVTNSAAAQSACVALNYGTGSATYSATQCTLPKNTRYCVGGTFPSGGDYNNLATLVTNSGGTLWRIFFNPDKDETQVTCTDIGAVIGY